MLVHDSATMGYFHSPGLYEVTQKLESKGFNLADQNITSDALTGIEILIGVDNFTRLIVRQKRSLGTSLFVTRGGGVIPFGPLPRWAVSTSQQSSQVRCARIICENKPELKFTQLWELERVGILPESFSPSERETISLVRSNMQKSESGYIVWLPFKDDTRPSVNYRTAPGQLNHLVQRAENDEQFGQHYNKVVRSYVEKEFIEQIPNHPIEGHYMPHHAVFKKSATTPLRSVFNASSRLNEGRSLNDCLMTGPSLTAKLHEILVQFRQETYAVTADILKAFHRIIVDEDHRKFLKFLWLNLESYELLTYQFKVVLFGATCSPYLLQETLQTHLSQNAKGNKFVDKFYVDNYMNTYDKQDELVTDKVTLDNVMNQALRAVHLEVVDNLTATSFTMCLRRLAAAKGMPTLILSDNHKTFIAGETFLLDMQQDPSVQEYLASKNVRWKHQTPRSPWMGGHFERLVRTIKASLATAISRKLLTLEEFTTIVKEAENMVNSRPLTYQSDESRDVPLSPSQLAWGRDLTLMPPLLQPGDPLDEDYDARATRAQYVLLSNALERFRKRWHTEYLLSLREKHYNKCAENPTHHLSVGKLVMVRHDNLHRIEWPLGVITAIYPDEKGVIRTAEVEE